MEAASPATVPTPQRMSNMDDEFDPFEFDDFNADMDTLALSHQPTSSGQVHGSLNGPVGESFQPPSSPVADEFPDEWSSQQSPGGFESPPSDELAAAVGGRPAVELFITPPRQSRQRDLPISESVLPVQKKIRLHRKTSAANTLYGTLVHGSSPASGVDTAGVYLSSPSSTQPGQPRAPDGERWTMPLNEWRKQFINADESLRKFYYSDISSHQETNEYRKAMLQWKTRKPFLYKQYACMPKEDKKVLARKAVVSTKLSDHEKSCIEGRFIKENIRPATESPDGSSKAFFCARHGLFTYHDAKWLFDRPEWLELSVEDVVAACQKDGPVKLAWANITEDLNRFNECQHSPKFGSSFELCTTTFKIQKVVKLHLHVCWRWLDKQHIRSPASFQIDRVIPVHVKQPPRECMSARAHSVNPMLYYLEMPKFGKVFHLTDMKAFLDYPVNPRWITGWLQGKKSPMLTLRRSFF